ncbi:hypothetical protein [Escherichia coli]|uniref:hypothetical protein n=1 Tax=Escherichia coli TaxID=562 RepID=UPI0021B48FAE|nr:hypothetical protein [Escherichia coli]
MRDLIIKFTDKADFSAFMKSAGYYDDESMQDDILIDVIGNVYKETGELTEDGEPVCVKKDGYFVNVRIINDAKKSSIFDKYAVVVEHQLRGWM